MCTMDIGPRWMLVTAEDADLRSVLADAFGCRKSWSPTTRSRIPRAAGA